jgi:prepilin-type processing-associated H-X9-DG protein
MRTYQKTETRVRAKIPPRSKPSRGSRSGITVQEVLVTIAIIGLLMALLLPAVMSSRATSRRMACANNLKQLILAMQNYEENHRVYPGGQNFYLMLLPQIDQVNTLNKWNDGVATPSLSPPANDFHIPTFLCPSDSLDSGYNHGYLPNYRLNGGSKFFQWRDGFTGEYRTLISNRDVPDGLSNTVALSEFLTYGIVGLRTGTPSTNPQLWPRMFWSTLSYSVVADSFADECEFYAIPPGSGWAEYPNELSHSVPYNHLLAPNRHSCTNGPDLDSSSNDVVTASSLHAGGVNVAMGDGSVKFVNDRVARSVWRAVGSRAGSEVNVADF